jgi:polar amino acid transport system substrate-binding protein
MKYMLRVLLVSLICTMAVTAAVAGALEDVKARGTLLVGVRFDAPPYGYVDKDGKNVGIDIDIANEIARRLGVGIEYIQVTAQTRIPTLESGKVDMLAAALTQTRERDDVIDFSISYIFDGQKLMVKKGSGITSVSDLTGKTVTTVQGSANVAVLEQLAPKAKLVVYQEYPQAFLALQRGLADAFSTTVLIMDQFARSDSDVEIVGPFLSQEPIGIGLRENDSNWRDTINALLQDMVRDGTYEKIWSGHLSVPPQGLPQLWP